MVWDLRFYLYFLSKLKKLFFKYILSSCSPLIITAFLVILIFRNKNPPNLSIKKELIGGIKMDRHPKRKKCKDNPYTLELNENKYIIRFKDIRNNLCELAITEDLYQVFNKFELEDISQMHKYDRHIEHSMIYEENLYKRSFEKQIDLESYVINKLTVEQIKIIIKNSLSEIQKMRLYLYFYENKTLQEIATMQGTTHQAISKCIKNSIKKIREIIIN